MKKNIRLRFLILTSFLSAMQIFYGCNTTALKKDTVPAINFTCDEKADEALKNRRYEKSIILHEFFIKENPDNGLAMYHLGYSHGQLGYHENEVECYEKAVKLGFHGSGIFFNLGMAYGEQERLYDAMDMFRKAIELDPEDADSIYQLGKLNIRTGQIEKAGKHLKELMKIAPDDEMTLDLKSLLEDIK